LPLLSRINVEHPFSTNKNFEEFIIIVKQDLIIVALSMLFLVVKTSRNWCKEIAFFATIYSSVKSLEVNRS